ncbi:MAG: hypothetical protein ACNA7J_03520 [Wenzhouxiangella sp.]
MKSIALFGAFLLMATSNAYGYLDPGSGSAILQGLIGALAAIAITLKLYWHRLLRFLGIRKSSIDTDTVDPGKPEKSDS